METFSKPKVTIDLEEYNYLLDHQYNREDLIKTSIIVRPGNTLGMLEIHSSKGSTHVGYILTEHIKEFDENGNFELLILKKKRKHEKITILD
jgi:hypothetical protein